MTNEKLKCPVSERYGQGPLNFINESRSRPLLADPDLPRKWKENRLEEVRPCIGDNKGCLGRLYQDLEVRCSVNPSLGRG